MKKNLVVFTAVLMLLGCNDPKAPSEANFKAALNADFAKNPACLMLADPHPTVVWDFPNFNPDDNSLTFAKDVRGVLIMNSLTAAGLYKRTESIRSGGLFPKPVYVYQPTEYGKKYIKDKEAKVCFAHREAIEVTKFTEPADQDGYKVSRVSYKRKYTNIAPWVQNQAVKNSLPRLIASLSKEHDEVVIMAQTSKGWEVLHDKHWLAQHAGS